MPDSKISDNSKSTVENDIIKPEESSSYVKPEQTYGVLIDGVYRFLGIDEARNIIENQQRQITLFTNRLKEIESNSSLIKKYFGKSVDVNKQLLDRYRKLLDWIFKGGISILMISLILLALPLYFLLVKYYQGSNIETFKNIITWIAGIYGLTSFGGLITLVLAAFGFKKQIDSIEKRLDRLEDKTFK